VVHRINGNMKLLYCLFYFNSIPAIDLVVIQSINKDTNTYIRILTTFCSTTGLIWLFLMNYSLSIVSKEAHRPYNKLYSIIARKPATTLLNLKVLGLIEKLSGPVIGLYCFDFFPFTNYEFYLYVSYCIQSFLLLIGLFGK